jgi:hypothetical protein
VIDGCMVVFSSLEWAEVFIIDKVNICSAILCFPSFYGRKHDFTGKYFFNVWD